MRMSRTCVLLLTAALLLAALPSVALGALPPRLTNPYGMVFAGQEDVNGRQCLSCHNDNGIYNETLHGRHAVQGILPVLPAAWTEIKGPGSVATVGSPKPGTGLQWFSAGGAYSRTGLSWMTWFDYEGFSRWSEEEGQLLFFNGSTATSTASPWSRVSGLGLIHTGPNVEFLPNTTALSDSPVSSTCGLVNCHFTGGTQPLSLAQVGQVIPNPAVASQPTTQTKTQWARDFAFTELDFNTSATVGYDGMGVQCEKCHGTGIDSDDLSGAHWNTGTQLSHRVNTATVNAQVVPKTTVATLGRSDVCGVCHGLRSAPPVAGVPQYLMGFTPNLPVRNFVSVNASRGANAPYTYRPTEAEFALAPAIYALFPNGNPKNGGHGGNQYWSWAASGHAVRPQTGRNDPDQLPGAANTFFNLAGAGTQVECLRCHSGEGYMTTKVPQVTDGRAVKSVWEGFEISKTNSGFMGQECVVCHDPHPKDADIAGTIRSADPAGKRSNFGRTNDNASVCEDCHNWQVETLANGLPLADFNPQALPGRVSHAQREVLHGVKRGTAPVMWEVADMGEFMPGAKCQDCHMPKTDSSAEYSSHGMHIQKPGDAIAWGATGEDSCTKCHEEAGDTLAESRMVLQEKLDEWQTEASSTAAAAKVAIDAAKLRAEFSTVAGRELYGRAWLNWNTFTNDASIGAHNPPYIVAGMNAAKRMSDSVGGSIMPYASASVRVNTMAYVAGNLSDGDGTPAVDAKVALLHNEGGVWVEVDSAMSDVNGNVSFMVEVPVVGGQVYRLRWDRCGNDNADLLGAITTTAVTKIPSKTTLVRSTSAILLGRTVGLSGAVTPAAPGKTVSIQAKKGTGSWRTITSATLGFTSKYAKTIKPSSRGTWYYRVKYAGSATVAASTSVTVKVVVR